MPQIQSQELFEWTESLIIRSCAMLIKYALSGITSLLETKLSIFHIIQ